jgi:hypothetical protein
MPRIKRHIKDPLVRIHAHVHYLTWHAPEMVRRRWHQAAVRWAKRTRWFKSGINDRL